MDRDLLVGILAWKRGWVAHDALLSAIEEAGSRPGESVAGILVERRALSVEERGELARLAANEPTRIREQVDRRGKTDVAWAALKQSITSLAGPKVEATLALFDDGPVLADLDEAHVSIKPGLVIDGTARFEVVRLHARGGLGEVHLARELGVPREVALKEIQPQYARDSECRRRFVCEAEVTGSLEHPGIVPVYSLGSHADGRPFYVMRFIAGQTLGEAISDYHYPPKDQEPPDAAARELAFRKLLDRYLDICQTIAYAHSRGVLHRDLKPDNVMLGAYGETLVVDWGLAKRVEVPEKPESLQPANDRSSPETGTATVLEPGSTPKAEPPAAEPNAGKPPPKPSDKTVAPDATRLGTIIGTPAYMSPEQALGWHDRLGPPADVFSLGAILYVILTGRPAAAGTSVQEVLQKAQACEFPRPSSLVPQTAAALEAICLKAMSKAATDRYPTAAELAADVENYLADQPVSAWAEPWHVTAGRWIRRHRTWAIGIGAGGGVLLACMLVGLVLLSSFNEQLRTERDRASTNFSLAQQAVDRYLVRVSDDPRLRAVGLESLRRDLLRDAGEFYDEFIRREGKQANLQLDLAKAHLNLGSITAEIDSTAEGIKRMRQALEVQQELAAKDPKNSELVEFGANVRNDLANLLVQVGQREEAVALYLEAEKQFASLAPSPDAARNRGRALLVASGQHNLGLAYHYLDRRADARKAYEQAAKQLTALNDLEAIKTGKASLSDPRVAYGVGLAANNLRDLSILEHEEGRLDEAARQLETARTMFVALLAEVKGESAYQTDLAGVYINLAALAQERRNLKGGLRHCIDGLALVVPLRKNHPQIDLYHSLEGKLLDSQAVLLWRSGEGEKALASSAQAIAERRGLAERRPENYEFRLELAGSLSNEAVIRLNLQQLEQVPELLREAIEIHSALAAGDKQPSEHRFLLVKDYDNLGQYEALTGNLEGALAERQKARVEIAKLVHDHPELPHYREFLLGVLTNYVNAANRLRRFEDSRAALADARKHAEELVRRFPQNLNSRRTLARVLYSTGQTANEEGKPDEAIDFLKQSIAEREKMIAEHPELPELKKDLATVRFELAQAYSQKKQPAETIAEYSAALDLYRALLAEPSVAHEAEYRLAQTFFSRSRERWLAIEEEGALADMEEAIRLGSKMLAERGVSLDLAVEAAASRGLMARYKIFQMKPQEALPHLDAAIDLLWPEHEKLGGFPLGRVTLLTALSQRASIRVAAGNYRDAAGDFGRAAEFSGGPTRIDNQMLRLQCLGAAGDHRAAIDGGKALIAEHPENHDLRWRLAIGCSIAVPLLEKDETLPPDDRKKWSEEYAALALAMLDQLATADALTKERRDMLATDPRWEALRQQGKLKRFEP